ncbi:MAG: hypothetical protein M0Z88_06595 [Actinomycetota bacterium]|nr:hypothetical protein [Actinomycetota bacterium]
MGSTPTLIVAGVTAVVAVVALVVAEELDGELLPQAAATVPKDASAKAAAQRLVPLFHRFIS